MNSFVLPSNLEFLASSYSNALEGITMGDIIFKKGQYWYVSITHQGTLLRRSLKTSDKDLAIKRFIALINSIEDGTYQFYSAKFDDLVKKYNPQVDRKNKLMNLENHVIPEFAGKRLHEINVQEWAEKIASTYCESSALAIIRPATELGLEVNYKEINFIKGRTFDGTQILFEETAFIFLDRLKSSPRSRKYHGLCYVALYSTMPLSDLLYMEKSQVVFTGPDAGITYTRRKTRHKNRPPLFVPMTNKLRDAFKSVPTPLNDDGRWFPPMNTSTVSSAVGRNLRASGWDHWGAMHVLRHFGACYLIKQGVALTTIQELMGHADFNTTLIYARTDRETLKEGMRKFDVK